jgi:hypothetical protein
MPIPNSQQCWVLSQHPPTQWNQRNTFDPLPLMETLNSFLLLHLPFRCFTTTFTWVPLLLISPWRWWRSWADTPAGAEAGEAPALPTQPAPRPSQVRNRSCHFLTKVPAIIFDTANTLCFSYFYDGINFKAALAIRILIVKAWNL